MSDVLIVEALRSGRFFVCSRTGVTFNKHGRPVGHEDPHGYIRISLAGGRHLLEHRVVWIWNYGFIPAGMTGDHRNEIKTDNRLENLRLVTRGDNVTIRWMHKRGHKEPR